MNVKKFYGIKDMEELLGIKRSTIRHWEEVGLLNKPSRNVINNSYREYTEDDLNLIWAIKLLRGIGYTITEIQDNIMGNKNFDFYKSISEKVDELEKKENECKLYLNFARSIKLTGRIPMTEIGTMKFNDFIEYSRKEWNFFDDEVLIPKSEKILEKKVEDLTVEEVDLMYKQYENFGKEIDISMAMMWNGCQFAYWTIFSSLRNYNPEDELIKKIFIAFYNEFNQKYADIYIGRKLEFKEFTKYFNPNYFDGTTEIKKREMYGEENINFIAEIFEYYNNIEIENVES